MLEVLFILHTSMREYNLTFKTAILATNLELFRTYFNNLKIWVLSSNEFDSLA